jgi:integrase/recombinase XerD
MKKRTNFSQWLELQNYQPTSIQRLLSIQQKAADYLITRGLGIHQTALQHFLQHCQTEGYSGAYLQQIQWALLIYCEYLNKVRGLTIQLQIVKLPKAQQRRIALPPAAIDHLENWLSGEQQDYWLKQTLWSLFYGAGLRRIEALNLQLQDFDTRRKLLEVRTAKTGKVRALPLSDRQTTAILNYIRQERPAAKEGYKTQLLLGRKGGHAQALLGAQLKLWQDCTGLGSMLCWHVLRHTIATQLVERRMPLEQVSRFLGHKHLVSTSHYLHYQKQESTDNNEL